MLQNTPYLDQHYAAWPKLYRFKFTALWNEIVIHMSCNIQKLGHRMKIGLGMEKDAGKHSIFHILTNKML